MSKTEKQRSRKRILDAAARLMRENGVETTSVSDVMQAAGLTHGGFYRHFPSKDKLTAEAFRHAVDEVMADVESAPSGTDQRDVRDRYIKTYLSSIHVKNRGNGCPLAAMGAEVGRVEGAARQEGSAAVKRVTAIIQDRNNTAEGQAMLALLLGAVTLARLAETDADAEEILEAGRTGVGLIQRYWPD